MEHFGNYILLEKISSGGMADIYKAARLGSSGFFKLLAIKRIKAHIAQDAGFQEMFIKEAHVQATFSHPNVVNIFDFGKEKDDFFIAMEYLNGVPLRTLLQMLRFRHERLRIELILHIFDSLLKGLDYIHNLVAADGTSMNIIHRDLDPNNVFLTFSGEIKLIDFGIADSDIDIDIDIVKMEDQAIKGKFSYLAPELLDGHTADQRSDLFSASLLFYELLTLHKLFAAETREKVLNNVMSLDIRGKVNALSIDDHLKKILNRALERDPMQRYGTASEFREDLRVYQQQHQVRAAPKTFPALMDHLFQKEQQEELKNNQFYFSILKDRDLTDDDHTCIIGHAEVQQEIDNAPEPVAELEDIAVEEILAETHPATEDEATPSSRSIPLPLFALSALLVLAFALLNIRTAQTPSLKEAGITPFQLEEQQENTIIADNSEVGKSGEVEIQLLDNYAEVEPADAPLAVSEKNKEKFPENATEVEATADNDSGEQEHELEVNNAQAKIQEEPLGLVETATEIESDNDQDASDIVSEPTGQMVADEVEQNAHRSGLEIQGTPQGQTVLLDEVELGELPLSIVVEPGFHSIECRKKGYWSHKVRVRVINEQSVTVECKLREKNATEKEKDKEVPLYSEDLGQ